MFVYTQSIYHSFTNIIVDISSHKLLN